MSFRKHFYSNILKISPPKMESFQIKILIFSHCCSKHRFKVLVKTALPRRFLRVSTIYVFVQKEEKYVYHCKPWFYCIKVWFKGIKIIYIRFRDGVCFVIIFSSSFFRLVPRECYVSLFMEFSWHFHLYLFHIYNNSYSKCLYRYPVCIFQTCNHGNKVGLRRCWLYNV